MVVPNEATFQTEAMIALGDVSAALEKKREEVTKGNAPKREMTWISTLLDAGVENKLKTEASFTLYTHLIENLETEYVPYILQKACVERGIKTDIAFKEAREGAFLARQKVTEMFLELGSEILSDQEKYKIAMHHLVSTYFEMGDNEFFKSNANTALIRNVLFSEITAYGIENGKELAEIIKNHTDIQDKQFARAKAYAKHFEDEDNSVPDLGTNIRRRRYAEYYRKPFQEFKERVKYMENGMYAEIYAAWILKHLTSGTTVTVNKASAEEDLTSQGDFFLAEPLDDEPNPDVFAAVDVKTTGGDALEIMVVFPNDKRIGKLKLTRPPSERMAQNAKESGIPLLVIRIPIERVLHTNLEELADQKSSAAKDASDMKELFIEAFGVMERKENVSTET